MQPEWTRELALAALTIAVRRGLAAPLAARAILALWPREAGETPSLDVAADERDRQATGRDAAPLDASEPRSLGARYEALLAAERHGRRKRRGSFYTPAAIARVLCARALEGREAHAVLDPACGTGAILLEALPFVPAQALFGVDSDPIALWLARVSLALATGALDDRSIDGFCARLVVGDALLDELPIAQERRFDAVIGNPPWVSFAGRAAAPLSAWQRRAYREKFQAFGGFPTAHGMFVERAASLLAPRGTLALLVPTPVADLRGYGATRAALAARARVEEPVVELGFDQFEGVVQPTMLLCATARERPLSPGELDPAARASLARPWAVASRAAPRPALAPSLLARLASLPRFAAETFGEGGFQSARDIARTHIGPLGEDPRFSVPLREGADVHPFACLAPSIGLDPEPAALAAARCVLRPARFYERVSVLVRQTARFPIASVHEPRAAFRNSLLAGFSSEPDALCALLNSALLRAAHLSAQRDGRQRVFPQVKVAHLRALPAPPPGASLRALSTLAAQVASLQRARLEATQRYRAERRAPRAALEPVGHEIPGSASYARALREPHEREQYEALLASLRAQWRETCRLLAQLDDAVFALYDVREDERRSVYAVLAHRE